MHAFLFRLSFPWRAVAFHLAIIAKPLTPFFGARIKFMFLTPIPGVALSFGSVCSLDLFSESPLPSPPPHLHRRHHCLLPLRVHNLYLCPPRPHLHRRHCHRSLYHHLKRRIMPT